MEIILKGELKNWTVSLGVYYVIYLWKWQIFIQKETGFSSAYSYRTHRLQIGNIAHTLVHWTAAHQIWINIDVFVVNLTMRMNYHCSKPLSLKTQTFTNCVIQSNIHTMTQGIYWLLFLADHVINTMIIFESLSFILFWTHPYTEKNRIVFLYISIVIVCYLSNKVQYCKIM